MIDELGRQMPCQWVGVLSALQGVSVNGSRKAPGPERRPTGKACGAAFNLTGGTAAGEERAQQR